MTMTGFGYAHFDEPTSPESGWAASFETHGEPKRISGIGSLRSDIIWMTNIEYGAWYAHKLGNMPNLRQSLYARSSIKSLVSELGLIQPQLRAEDICATLYEVFDRMLRIAERAVGFNILSQQHKKFSEAIRTLLIGEREPKEYTCNEPSIIEAFANAIQPDSGCHAVREGSTRYTWVGVRRNRLQHALDILSTPIPQGPWEVVSQHLLPADDRDRVAWLLAQTRPTMARVSIVTEDTDRHRMVAFGVPSVPTSNKPKKNGMAVSNLRQWVSAPELLMLSAFTTMRVNDVLLAESYAPLVAKKSFPMPLEPHDWMSTSFGLFAENYWSAMALPMAAPVSHALTYTARSVWLRAADRVYSFHAAMQMRLSGIAVGNYGSGAVGLWVPEGGMAHALDAAARAGLIAPMLMPESARLERGLEAAA